MGKAVEQMLPLMKTKNQLLPFLNIAANIAADPSDLFAVTAPQINTVEIDVLADVSVWIDFTSGAGLTELLRATAKLGTPVVSGSTGLSKADFGRLRSASKKRNIFWASNMSPGLWAFRQAMKGLSTVSNFDFSIEEIHHTQKKDRPSGTAKTLHSDLQQITAKKIDNPVSLRLGGVFGIHTLLAASSNEMITMQHQALNRTVFADGALLACDWLVGQSAGLYTMDDLFLKK